MNIQLSISLLVSDRADSLKKCLDSLKGLLRELPCELIAVFTGKKEETLEIIREYTDHIISFEWCNDFSAARNAGLKEAKGEWFMFIDDDEWFEDTQELIRFFGSGEYQHFHSATYIVRNYIDWSGNVYEDTSPIRLAKHTEDLCFHSSIHEHLHTAIGLFPIKYLNDYVHHYGYVTKKVNKIHNRAKRNIPLLLKEIEQHPEDGKHYMQIAQEYRNEKNYRKAEEYTRKGLELAYDTQRIYTFESWMRVYLPIFIEKQGEQRRALQEAEKLVKQDRSNDLVKLYLYRSIAQISAQLEENKKTVEAVRNFFIFLEKVEMHPEEYLIQASAGLTLDNIKSTSYVVYSNGLIAATNLNDCRLIYEFLKMIPWDSKHDMVDNYYSFLEQWKKNNAELRLLILEAFSKINSKNSYILCQKMLYAKEKNKFNQMKELYKKCCKSKNRYIQNDLIRTAVMHDLEMTAFLKGMTLEEWNNFVIELLSETSLDEETVLEKMKYALKPFPLYHAIFQQQFVMKYIQEKVLEGDELIEALTDFCQITLNYSHSVYHTQMFEKDNLHSLPTITQFAIDMQEVLEAIQTQEYETAIQMLRETLEILPQLRMMIKRVLDYVITKSDTVMKAQNQEFYALGMQIKQAVREMLERREYRTAEPIIQQLCTLLPNDLEVLRMKQQILTKTNE